MIDLDTDALTITSWEAYAQACFKAGETWRLRKKLSEHIYWVNRGILADQSAYCVRRQGEWARDELDAVIRNKKLMTEMKMEWRMLKLQMFEVLTAYINNFDKKLFESWKK